MIFAWWMACLSDAYGATYYRRKPQVEDEDYDVDFYTVDPVSTDPDGQTKPDPREHLEVGIVNLLFEFLIVYRLPFRSSWYALAMIT